MISISKKNFNFLDSFSLIKYPLITEKTVKQSFQNKYVFIVAKSLSKSELKIIFQKIFLKRIFKINTLILYSKKLKKSRYKKVILTFSQNNF